MEDSKTQKVEDLIEENPKHFYWKIKNNFPNLFEAVEDQYEDKDSFSEGLYLFLYGEDKAKCDLETCSNFCTFRSVTDGYRSYCSKECMYKSQENKEARECIVCGSQFKVRKSRDKKICSRKCWRKWNRREDVQNKFKKSRKETLQERYGNKKYRNLEGAKKTKKERYGDPHYNNTEKIKETMEEEYGGVGFQSEYIRKKARKTNIKEYGVENAAKADEIKEKISNQQKKKGYKTLCSDKGRFEYVEPLFDFEDYVGRYDAKAVEYDFKCLKCNNDFVDIVRYPIRPRCPNCFPLDRSKMEKDLQEFISSLVNCEVKVNYYGLLKGNRELDLYIPEKDVAIEFDGIYWHSENGKGECGRNYHLNKTEECEQQGVQLIHIFENEWVEKKDIVKNRLSYILNEYDGKRVYARNTEVKKVGSSRKNEFLNNNHLQGGDRSNAKLGLFCGDELVSLMTFSRRRIALGGQPEDDSWELSRFCSTCSVVGGASKLFKNFVRKHDPETIITYADRRWTSPVRGDVFYEKIGFEFDGMVRPSYFYFHESDKLNLMHRFNFRKNVLNEKLEHFDPDLTEWENMKRNGYDRIWDCGKLRYIWNKIR